MRDRLELLAYTVRVTVRLLVAAGRDLAVIATSHTPASRPSLVEVYAGRPPRGLRFDGDEPAIRLGFTVAGGSPAFEVDAEARTIKGLAVPYGIPAKSGGKFYRFGPDSLAFAAPSRVKLWVQHDNTQAVGVMLSATDGTVTLDNGAEVPGKLVSFKVARGSAGDTALSLADDGVLDGLSVGLADGGTYTLADDGVYDVVSAPWMETSLTPAPAFDDARVHSVAASAARSLNGGNMECTSCGVVHAAGVTACDPATLAAFTAAQSTGTGTVAPIVDAITAGFAQLTQAAGPQPVSASASLEVTEESPYRFDGLEGAHEFSDDLVAFGRDRDGDAGERLMAFMAEAFAPGRRNPRFDVERADVTTVNPSPTRADMYVDGRRLTTPVYDALYSGAITDNTPFIVPKFSSDSTLVSDHTEKTEPTEGTFVATSQTVTPTPVSGKVPITREVWDQGGNPQVSGLIWSRMQYAYYQNLETAAAGVLTAAAGSITDVPLTAGGSDDDLVNELEAALADLNFAAGGDTLRIAMTHVDLYKKLAAAVDSTGRKLLPLYGVTNGNGQARPRFASLDVAGFEFAPAKSLGATSGSSSNSWLIDPDSVHVWNSAPTRLEFDYRVAYVDLAVWGYKAAAVTDTAGVRQITYDPTA